MQQQQKRYQTLPQLAQEASDLKEQLAKERINITRLRFELGAFRIEWLGLLAEGLELEAGNSCSTGKMVVCVALWRVWPKG